MSDKTPFITKQEWKELAVGWVILLGIGIAVFGIYAVTWSLTGSAKEGLVLLGVVFLIVIGALFAFIVLCIFAGLIGESILKRRR